MDSEKMAEEDQLKLPPARPPPPSRITLKSTTFDGPVRLNDLLEREDEVEVEAVVEEGKAETTSLVSSGSGDSSTAAVPVAETACSYFDEERDVLKTPPVRYRGRSPLTKSQSTDAQFSDRDSVSVGSNESSNHTSKLQTIIDKVKAKGKKIMHRKNKSKKSEGSNDEVEVEVSDEEQQVDMDHDNELLVVKYKSNSAVENSRPKINIVESESHPQPVPPPRRRHHSGTRKIPFFKFRLTVAALMLVGTVFLPYFLSGFLWGVYICTVIFLYTFVSKPIDIPQDRMTDEVVQKVSEEIDRQKQVQLTAVYKGWMNELKGRYDPANYHVNQTRLVLVRLDGKYLRISRPKQNKKRNVVKHSFYNDPTVTDPEPTMIGQSLYDLTNAEVTLRPKSLAPRRWWVRKYPIHIRLASKASVITMVSNEETKGRRSSKISERSERSDPADDDDSESSAYEADSSDEEAPESVIKTHHKSGSVSETDLRLIGSTTDGSRPLQPKGPQGKSIYLFVRSHREKERWFHRLRETTCQHRTLASGTTVGAMHDFVVRRQSAQSLPEATAVLDAAGMSLNHEYFLYVSTSVQFSRYMAEVLSATPEYQYTLKDAGGTVIMDLAANKWTPSLTTPQSDVASAANALASRIFYDFCRDEYWVTKVRNKIQCKLATIHLPYFIEMLELSKLELGTVAPRITCVHAPTLNEWGTWVDVEISYPGGLRLMLETKVNLMKLKSGEDKEESAKRKPSRYSEVSGHSSRHSHQYSDEERPISPESSPDEDADVDKPDNTGKGKLLTFVDKLANSSIFQGATDLKPVKKMMEGISSTPLILNVEVTGLEGTMAINFAPPPSDRIWYGFRRPPKLTLKGVPQVGDRAVEFSKVSDWIENRLRVLLEKNIVMPGMDDIMIPVMSGNEMLNLGYNK